jgi:restriction system protein
MYKGPKASELLWQLIEALKELNGSGSNREIEETVVMRLGLSEEDAGYPHGNGPRTEINYQLAWAQTRLKRLGILENNGQSGIWSLSEQGWKIAKAELEELKGVQRAKDTSTINSDNPFFLEERAPRQFDEAFTESITADVITSDEIQHANWEQQLLAILYNMSPKAFERLAARILREEGYTHVEVTGGKGDGGIDGSAEIESRLVTQRVYFQCKRYKDRIVKPDEIRAFQTAVGIKKYANGIVFTTGRFTDGGRQAARKDGAVPVELIDGEKLCALLKKHKLGVEVKTIEQVEIKRDLFSALES